MKYSWMILFICLCGCDVELQKEYQRQRDATLVRSTYYLDTIVHDEHLFIISRYGHFIHHMDCPCLKNKTDKEPVKLEPPTVIFDIIKGNRP